MTDEKKPEDSMPKIRFDDPEFEYEMKKIAKEKRIMAMFRKWEAIEPPPCDLFLSTDWGYRASVKLYNAKEKTDKDKRSVLHWLIRSSGKKFMRAYVNDDIVWSNDHVSNGNSDEFHDEHGKFEMFIIFRGGSMDNCKIVEKTKTVKVKELVCE